MPKETLERAIKKGAGLLDGGAHLERLIYEGFAPHKVPVIVECLTDNVNRTYPNIRVLFRKGQLGAAGSVQDFDHVGMIEATPNSKRQTRKSRPSKRALRTSNPPTKARRCSSPTSPTSMPCAAPCRRMATP